MNLGLFRGCLVLAVGLVGVAGFTPISSLLASSAPVASPILNLQLATSDLLPQISKNALIAETDSIWRQSHVRLHWLAGHDEGAPTGALRVLVTPRAVASANEGREWAVGELLRFEGSSAIAVASIAGAQRIVDESSLTRPADAPATRNYRLGVVLGRAVAHEIGHYVLRTNTHASTGLMRANINAREFADLRTGTFGLDDAARAHLAFLAVRAPEAVFPPSRAFSYSVRRPSRRGPD